MNEAMLVTTVSHEYRPGKEKVRSRLLMDLWPEADRRAWRDACQPAARLKRGGAAGHLKPVSRDGYAEHYSYFLGSVARRGLLETDAPPAANVTPENVDHSWIARLRLGILTLQRLWDGRRTLHSLVVHKVGHEQQRGVLRPSENQP